MKSVKEIMKEWKKRKKHLLEVYPDSAMTSASFGPQEEALDAAYRIWEVLLSSPFRTTGYDNHGHPKYWDEATLLMIAGCIQEKFNKPIAAVVHHMEGGETTCGKPGQPIDWEDKDRWASQWKNVTCPACLRASVAKLIFGRK